MIIESLLTVNNFKTRRSNIIKKLEANEYVDLIEVLVFLKKWLVDHILGVDKKYGAWFNERGIK